MSGSKLLYKCIRILLSSSVIHGTMKFAKKSIKFYKASFISISFKQEWHVLQFDRKSFFYPGVMFNLFCKNNEHCLRKWSCYWWTNEVVIDKPFW